MDNTELAPIILFAYNRPWHLAQTVNAVLHNKYAEESHLIVYSDGAKNHQDQVGVEEVRSFLKNITGFKKVFIHEREKNFGLADNIIEGITEILDNYGKAIILEDDHLTSPFFLEYINEGLIMYQHSEKVISLHGYIYPIKKKLPETFFLRGADCLGWGTWRDKWKLFERDGNLLYNLILEKNLSSEFDFNGSFPYMQMLREQIEGKISSWAIRWHASAFINDMLTLYPGRSLVFHIGNDGSGTNFNKSSLLDVTLAKSSIRIKDIPEEENISVRKKVEKFLKYRNAGLFRIIYRILKRRFYKL